MTIVDIDMTRVTSMSRTNYFISMFVWCIYNIGKKAASTFWLRNNHPWTIVDDTNNEIQRFCFLKEEDATLFKLTWWPN